ncbi:ferrichrome ABC transporter ATP-binding protein [Legionella santicrucis]|uniref:Ferrichrome ABC transporter ATP-binding protein n=1 Tax=Legionella santicrucis TaxID=45074 RepID=A0A0W0YIQ2_9GAMM|nr:ABC transporter ATP-binding protein [Legionella santicrucis]KTD56796.1 ferrichrome ABC transporter ATP-binding protein [Legionella santicrucis]
MVEINATDLNVFLDRNHIIKNLSLTIPANQVTAIIGPNGSGKSTLLKTLSGLMKPHSGKIYIDKQSIDFYSRKQLARKMSFLMQNPEAPGSMTVKELVSFGRFSHQTWFGSNNTDHDQIQWAIKQVNLEDKSNHCLSKLSGGQQKRAWIAMALAQNSDVLLLDEPTAFLDIRHQLETLLLLRKLKRDLGKTIVVVLHDIPQVIQFADYLIIIDQGKLIHQNPIQPNLDPQLFEKVFGIEVELKHNQLQGTSLTIHGVAETQGS